MNMHLRLASIGVALLAVALITAACSPQRTSEAYDVLQDIDRPRPECAQGKHAGAPVFFRNLKIRVID